MITKKLKEQINHYFPNFNEHNKETQKNLINVLKAFNKSSKISPKENLQ